MSSRQEYASELRNEYANFSRYALNAWLAAVRPASLTDLPRLPVSRRSPGCRSPRGERSSVRRDYYLVGNSPSVTPCSSPSKGCARLSLRMANQDVQRCIAKRRKFCPQRPCERVGCAVALSSPDWYCNRR